ncbi:uncharacterized protein JCM6883_006482 [Sporobolomyces salmoneus]|uniref:uncharacterized protein n=1 Tax=Sporobolomyces salmoneus TaxID=183962 RepID=UPI0031754B95
MYDFEWAVTSDHRGSSSSENKSLSSSIDPRTFPDSTNLNIIKRCDCSLTRRRTKDIRVTDNLEDSTTNSRRRRRDTDPRRRRPSATTLVLPSSSPSVLLATTSILFAATASFAQAAPQPRSTTTSSRHFDKSKVIGLDSASTSPFFPESTLSPSLSESTTATTPTSPPSRARSKRLIPPKYEYSDGSWVLDTSWTLRGSIPTLKPHHTRHAATALADSVETSSLSHSSSKSSIRSLSPSSHSPTRTTSPPTTAFSSPSTRVYIQHAYASASEVPIPRGWQTRPRETDYYAVPIIISMSVLVAIMVVIAMIVSVCWRKKKRRRRDPEKDVIQEKGWRGIVQRATGRRGGGREVATKKRRRKRKVQREPETVVAAAPVEREEGVTEQRTREDNQSVRESVGSAGSGNRTPRIVRTTGFTAVSERSRPRWRRRRRGRNGDEDGEGERSDDEERTALTRTDTRSTTSSAGGPRDALTARLASRLQGSNRERTATGPSTVFSRLPGRARSSSDLDPFPRTSTQESHLTRSTSRSSLYETGRAPVISTPSILFTPADDPTLSPRPPGTPTFETLSRVPSRTGIAPSSPTISQQTDPLLPAAAPSSFNALLSHDADMVLPLMPGPPAYRPASSTLQATRRYGAGDQNSSTAPQSTTASRIANIGRRRRRPQSMAEQVEEGQGGEWHWPGEKDRNLGEGTSSQGGEAAGSSTSQFVVSEEEEQHSTHEHGEEKEEEPPVDRSLYQAHLATDDKAVLNRLRSATYSQEASIEHHSRPDLPTPSAPPVVEDDIDEDGFERFSPQAEQRVEDEERSIGFTSSEKAKLRAPPSPHQGPVSTLPAPPSRTDFTYSYLPSTSAAATPSRSTATAEKSALAAQYAALDSRDGEAGEEVDLPVYLPQERRNEALGLASAPPATAEDDDDVEEEERDEEGVTFATI